MSSLPLRDGRSRRGTAILAAGLLSLSIVLAGTIGGAVFLFCSLVAVRGLLVLFVRPQFASTVGTLLQFVFLSGVLCFMMLPTTMGKSSVPIAWFYGLFQLVRGSPDPAVQRLAHHALVALPISIAAAVVVSFGSYWSQMRAALAPPARVGATAGLRRRMARLIAGRDSIAR